MTTLNEAQRRDFVTQMIVLVEQEKDRLLAKGYDSTARIEVLKTMKATCDSSEMAQQEAQAKAKEATKISNKDLTDAYQEASAFADTLSGILGKDDEMVMQMRKLRK